MACKVSSGLLATKASQSYCAVVRRTSLTSSCLWSSLLILRSCRAAGHALCLAAPYLFGRLFVTLVLHGVRDGFTVCDFGQVDDGFSPGTFASSFYVFPSWIIATGRVVTAPWRIGSSTEHVRDFLLSRYLPEGFLQILHLSLATTRGSRGFNMEHHPMSTFILYRPTIPGPESLLVLLEVDVAL